MSSPPPQMKKTSAVTPRKTMRGHTDYIFGVAHLPGGQHIITCSADGSLRLWDLKNGAQIGEEWRDEEDKSGIRAMALSPSGKTIASGSRDGTMRLWDVEMKKVVLKWKGHSGVAMSVCWSPNGERVVSGSNTWNRDGTVRVWEAKSGEPVQGLNPIKTGTGDECVTVVSYSPGAKMIATGVLDKEIEIWDANSGKRLSTIKLDQEVYSLAWTSDEKRLIAGLDDSIRIFDTVTWQQIAELDGHRHPWVGPGLGSASDVYSLTLFQNDRLLASTSLDRTTRLWDLDTNRQVGPPLQHQEAVMCAAFSADGKLLSTATGYFDHNAYVWDIYAVLKAAGLEELLSIPDAQNFELKKKPSSDANATRRPPIRQTPGPRRRRVPQGFFGDVQNSNPPPPQRRRRSFAPSWGLHPRALLARLPQPFHRSQPNANEPIELQQRPGPSTSRRSPSIVNTPCIDDKKALYVARLPETASEMAKRIKNPKWWVRVVLFICCVSPGTNDSPGANDNPGANNSPGTNNTPGTNNSPGTDGAQHHPST